MKLDQELGDGVAGGIGVEAAVEGQALGDERGKPRGVGSGTGGGEAAAMGMKDAATEGVDGRFAEDEGSPGVTSHNYTIDPPHRSGSVERRARPLRMGRPGGCSPAGARGNER